MIRRAFGTVVVVDNPVTGLAVPANVPGVPLTTAPGIPDHSLIRTSGKGGSATRVEREDDPVSAGARRKNRRAKINGLAAGQGCVPEGTSGEEVSVADRVVDTGNGRGVIAPRHHDHVEVAGRLGAGKRATGREPDGIRTIKGVLSVSDTHGSAQG